MFPSQKWWARVKKKTRPPKLQWGRDVSIPEMNQAGIPRWASEGLQWGRDVSIPEIMAIRSERMYSGSLQWGRDVSIPEMWWRRLSGGIGAGFNGAGMFPSQKWNQGTPA